MNVDEKAKSSELENIFRTIFLEQPRERTDYDVSGHSLLRFEVQVVKQFFNIFNTYDRGRILEESLHSTFIVIPSKSETKYYEQLHYLP